jgi:hypothetical protein
MKYIIFGSSGRLGRLAIQILKKKSIEFYVLSRKGDITNGIEKIANIYDESATIPFKHCLIDASIDYSSIDNMVHFESIKRKFIYSQYLKGNLIKIVAFSSGAVEFDDANFKNNFYLIYKKEKNILENFLVSLNGTQTYCPRIFTLIGKESYKVKTVGWVNIVDQVLSMNCVRIGKFDKEKTWVSEDLVSKKIDDFISDTKNYGVSTPFSGIFTLKEVAIQSAFILNKNIEFKFYENDTWLSVPYISKAISKDLTDLSEQLRYLILH